MRKALGRVISGAIDSIMLWSLKIQKNNLRFDKLEELFEELQIDLSRQYTRKIELTPFLELKIKNEHAFQVGLAKNAIQKYIMPKRSVHVVDIGDSAGTHIKKLRKLLEDENGPQLQAVSVNLDSAAVEKIIRGGGTAVCCRAEEYVSESRVDLFLSYEMVEHLHNPALFFHHLAKADNGDYMVITVPYVRNSRVALRSSLSGQKNIHAEGEHIFELSPADWKKLILHSGWRTLEEEIYFQYPTGIPVISPILRKIWQRYDFEGFLGLVMKRDMSVANEYLDWED